MLLKVFISYLVSQAFCSRLGVREGPTESPTPKAQVKPLVDFVPFMVIPSEPTREPVPFRIQSETNMLAKKIKPRTSTNTVSNFLPSTNEARLQPQMNINVGSKMTTRANVLPRDNYINRESLEAKEQLRSPIKQRSAFKPVMKSHPWNRIPMNHVRLFNTYNRLYVSGKFLPMYPPYETKKSTDTDAKDAYLYSVDHNEPIEEGNILPSFQTHFKNVKI